MNCPHGGMVQIQPTTGGRVLAENQPVCVMDDVFLVVGCPLARPCTRVVWQGGSLAARVRVNGRPALLRGAEGLCLDGSGVPQGPVLIQATQVRVRGT
jgi:hypothetical protein